MDANFLPVEMIEAEGNLFAGSVMVANYFIAVDVQSIEWEQLPTLERMIEQLYPNDYSLIEVRPWSISEATALLTKTMVGWTKALSNTPEQQTEALAHRFLRLLDSPRATYFELIDLGKSSLGEAHPHAGFSYWNFWILVVDEEVRRGVALALGASD